MLTSGVPVATCTASASRTAAATLSATRTMSASPTPPSLIFTYMQQTGSSPGPAVVNLATSGVTGLAVTNTSTYSNNMAVSVLLYSGSATVGVRLSFLWYVEWIECAPTGVHLQTIGFQAV